MTPLEPPFRDPRADPAEGDVVVTGYIARRVTRVWLEAGQQRVAWVIEGSTTGLAGQSSVKQWRRWARPQPPETADLFPETTHAELDEGPEEEAREHAQAG